MRRLFFLFPLCFMLLGSARHSKVVPPEPDSYALVIAPSRIDNSKINRLYHNNRIYGSMDFVREDINTIKFVLELSNFKNENISVLTGEEVLKNSVIEELRRLSRSTKKNDLVFIYFSGHGDQLKERIPGNEDDSLDEVMVLTNEYFVDDDFEVELANFNKGQKVLVVIDACHSGTTMKFVGTQESASRKEAQLNYLRNKSNKNFLGNDNKSQQVFENCKLDNFVIKKSKANLIYFGASADSEEAKANFNGSYLTNALHRALKRYPPQVDLNYHNLFCEVFQSVQKDSENAQRAHYYEVGKVDSSFFLNYPLKIK